ncbi:beta-ketoacyl synthase N-terminal-like domain-containing protein, partial [Streptomyces sp. W16]|uniref:type I polyketide synthase n=1 Tax=Streptomyces sp. W16 TaxID=3076631 RepID=UPI00295A9F8B
PDTSDQPAPRSASRAAHGDFGDRPREPVAIVGMGLRLPGQVDTPAAYWRLLRDGRDAVTDVPADRWRPEDFWDPDVQVPGRTVSRWGGFLSDPEHFDAAFFGISRREALRMDPQQRLVLETTQSALDDAGLARHRLAGSDTGVFAGIGHPEYAWINQGHPLLADSFTATGSFPAVAANRVSYVYDLRGPSYTVDAVCSSALLALHLASRSIERGDCAQAIVTGANLTLTPSMFIWFSKLGVMSPDGRCRSFDADASGIVFGEGVVSLVLKPLSAARADGDRVYALLRGSSASQEGRTNGLTAPSREGQEEMLRRAYRDAGIAPHEVRYVEAHGTGTLVGDPIETHALGAVLGAGRAPEDPCWIGSVKSNLGHLGMVAGLAGLAKTALALHHRELPPSLHYERENPRLDLPGQGLRVVDRLTPWPGAGPARAGVTSLSFGGTNVHVVLEEAESVPRRPDPLPAGEPYLLPLSAHTGAALREAAAGLADLARGA